jgi:hypothetical protein
VPRLFVTAALLLLAACGVRPASDGPDAGNSDPGVSEPYDAGTPDVPSEPDGGCLASTFLAGLGKDQLLLGASMTDETAAAAPFSLRYRYLSGGLFDGEEACTSCTSGCTAGGSSCAAGACGWWGCWQDTQLPPGEYVRAFVRSSLARGQVPMLTYYELLHASGVAEGAAEVAALADVALMRRYYGDWRTLLRAVGSSRALLHVEPDLWGYLQHAARHQGRTPAQLPAAVASANPTDCSQLPNSVEGFGRCLVAMTRRYAPNARVAFHASGWATGIDVLLNRDASLDVAAEARKTADFLVACGARETDVVVVDAADRDAAWYERVQGRDRWWSATDTALPHFAQALTWAQALSERIGRPHLWWQLPVGNMSLPNTHQRWQDNRVDGFLDRMPEVSAAHGVGLAFGAGEGAQTTPETDGDHLVSRVRALAAAGGQRPCR